MHLYPRRRTVAAQVAQELKTVTSHTLPLLWRNAEQNFFFFFFKCTTTAKREPLTKPVPDSHGDDGSHIVEVADADADEGDAAGEEQGAEGLAALGGDGEEAQEGDDSVLRDGLEQTGGACVHTRDCAGICFFSGTVTDVIQFFP